MKFRETVYELLASSILMPANGPNILLSHLEEFYEICIDRRKNEYWQEKLADIKKEIERTLISCGYSSEGEIIGSSQIHRNMSALLAKECPVLVFKNQKAFEEGTFGGVMNAKHFFEIWNDPNKIDVICNGNQAVKIIWGAYFYLLAIGEISVNFGRGMDDLDKAEREYLNKAKILCPNEVWITDAKLKIENLRSLYQKERETSEKSCFIATAAFGSSMATEVCMLRNFRDSYLNTTGFGKAIINVYYLLSPPIAKIIIKNNTLRFFTRALLKPLIFLVGKERNRLVDQLTKKRRI